MDISKKVISIRTPKTNLPVLNPIKKRFSPRVFSTEAVSEKDLKIIFEAARLAPSGRNNQPWFYFWVRKGSKTYGKIIDCLPLRNLWAESAPVIIIACCDPTEPKDIINRWALYDLGASVMSLVLQATELGYYCRQIGSFDLEKTIKFLNIRKPLKPFTLIALGKIGTSKDYDNSNKDFVNKDMVRPERKNTVETELL